MLLIILFHVHRPCSVFSESVCLHSFVFYNQHESVSCFTVSTIETLESNQLTAYILIRMLSYSALYLDIMCLMMNQSSTLSHAIQSVTIKVTISRACTLKLFSS